MSIGLIGKKIGMTQIFTEERVRIPVTVIQAGPCLVIGKKTLENDGYNALILSFGNIREKLVKKAQRGIFKKIEKKPKRYIREFRVADDILDKYNIGDEIKTELFDTNTKIDVIAISKGKGYQGAMKRHGFGGGPKTHGSKFHRALGSTGMHSYPGRTVKGTKMPGKMGNKQRTVLNLRIVKMMPEENVILVKGAVPGPRDGIVKIRKSLRS